MIDIHKKEYIVVSIAILCAVLCVVQYFDLVFFLQKLYSRVSDVLATFVTLLCFWYFRYDCHRFRNWIKACYAMILGCATVNLFLSFRIMQLKLIYWNYCPEYVDQILQESYHDYITEYSIPIIIFVILISFFIWLKLKRL